MEGRGPVRRGPARPAAAVVNVLGGLLKHLAYVEDFLFGVVLGGNSPAHPWSEVDWRADGDWDWSSAGEQTGDELHSLWREAVDASRRQFGALGGTAAIDLEPLVTVRGWDEQPSVRFVLTHMIEKYGRRCGHADLLREAIDGEGGVKSTNYTSTFIAVAEDCPAINAQIPQAASKGPTIASLQHELLSGRPYELTSEDLIFRVHALRKGLDPDDGEARAAFFSTSQACLRSSPLAKRYGWALHHDADGRVALVGLGSELYDELSRDASLTQTRALRSRRRAAS